MPGSLDLGDTTEVRPGDTVEVGVHLGSPVALTRGLGFTVREAAGRWRPER